MLTYRVRYMHKIAQKPDDYGPDLLLPAEAFADKKTLGKALRDGRAMLPGASIVDFRTEQGCAGSPFRIVAFPNARGHWHAIILEAR